MWCICLSMAQQLFLVDVEFHATAVVVAESQAEAEKQAQFMIRDLSVHDYTYAGRPLDHVPVEYADNIPYGYRDPKDFDRTTKQWVEAGAAPHLKE